MPGHLFYNLNGWSTAELHINAIIAGGYCSFDHQNIFTGILFYGRAQRGLRLRSRSSHQSLVVVEGDQVQYQLGQTRMGGPEQRFGAAGAHTARIHLERPFRRSAC